MTNQLRRSMGESALFGLVSAGLLGAAVGAVSYAQGRGFIRPFHSYERMIGFDGANPTFTLVAGGFVLLALGGLVGVAHGFFDAQLSDAAQTNWVWQLFLGLVAGAGLYALSHQLLGRAWGLEDFIYGAPPLQLTLHLLFFGLPLGVLYRSGERWARRGHVQEPVT